VADIQAII